MRIVGSPGSNTSNNGQGFGLRWQNKRKSKKKNILTKYPGYVEKILFNSIKKMKQVSEDNVIDYALIKCRL